MSDSQIEVTLAGEGGEVGDARTRRLGLAAKPASPWLPKTVCSIPKRSSMPRVCAKSRAVTVTAWPRARMRAIKGRKITTCGELVMSTQMRSG